MDEPTAHQVQYTEPAEIEVETERSRLAGMVSEKYADRWQDGLLAEIDRLSLFPASREVARENTHYDIGVRRL